MEWPELLLIDKPSGITSFDVIRRLRREYLDTHDGDRAPKMGHAGTLDPLATGLMLIGVGAGTKQLGQYLKLDKTYVASVLIGEQRTTGDMEGEVVSSKPVDESVKILQSKISTELRAMSGTLTLPVSAYSAIKVDGVPMYKRARAAAKNGEQIPEVPLREMHVIGAELTNINGVDGRVVATIRFHVGSGTYIRSLAEELGRRLGYPACLAGLRRTTIGDFTVADARPVPSVQ